MPDAPSGPQFFRVLGGPSLVRAAMLQRATGTPGCPIEKFWLADIADVPAVARHRVERLGDPEMLPGLLHPREQGIRFAAERATSGDPRQWHFIVEIGGLDHLVIDGLPLPPSAFIAALARMGEQHDAIEAALAGLREAGSLRFGDLARRSFRNVGNLGRQVAAGAAISWHAARPEQAVADCVAIAAVAGRATFVLPEDAGGDPGLVAVREGLAMAGLEVAASPGAPPAASFRSSVLRGRALLENLVPACKPVVRTGAPERLPGPDDADAWGRAVTARFPGLARHAGRLALPLGRMCEVFIEQQRRLGRSTRLLEDFLHSSGILALEPAYRGIQREHLSAENLACLEAKEEQDPGNSHLAKYLDLPFWMASKLAAGRSIGLDRRPGSSVLDIGSGPGHLGLVARHHGCSYLGLDMWQDDKALCSRNCLYDDLLRLFDLRRTDMLIEPSTRFEGLPRFDFVICLMGNFSVFRTGEMGRRWNRDEWKTFLANLDEAVLHETTTTFLKMNRSTIPPEVGAWLAERAVEADPAAGQYRFSGRLRL